MGNKSEREREYNREIYLVRNDDKSIWTQRKADKNDSKILRKNKKKK